MSCTKWYEMKKKMIKMLVVSDWYLQFFFSDGEFRDWDPWKANQ